MPVPMHRNLGSGAATNERPPRIVPVVVLARRGHEVDLVLCHHEGAYRNAVADEVRTVTLAQPCAKGALAMDTRPSPP